MPIENKFTATRTFVLATSQLSEVRLWKISRCSKHVYLLHLGRGIASCNSLQGWPILFLDLQPKWFSNSLFKKYLYVMFKIYINFMRNYILCFEMNKNWQCISRYYSSIFKMAKKMGSKKYLALLGSVVSNANFSSIEWVRAPGFEHFRTSPNIRFLNIFEQFH